MGKRRSLPSAEEPIPTVAPPPLRAAEYVRMSTDHQRYSIDNQRAAIRAYAAHHHIEIVRSYEDAGRSGLTILRREALQQLLRDVLDEAPEFSLVLVYDVSRWGRFQDTDESAYYEFHCRNAGVQIRYCGELFENDGSMTATILKSMKRAMAAEYSRELSSKVAVALKNVVVRGYWPGGPAPFGLRRMMCDADGKPKARLRHGEQKSLHSDRVVLVPGPETEVAAVRWAFEAFGRKHLTTTEIAAEFNRRGLRNPRADGRWTFRTVRRLLGDELYLGVMVYNRSSQRLATPRQPLPREQWTRRPDALPAIIDEKTFAAVARRMVRPRRGTEAEYLAALKALLEREGALSPALIDNDRRCPSYHTYIRRFGGIRRAYERIGYTPPQDFAWMDARQVQQGLLPQIMQQLAEALAAHGQAGRIAPAGDWIMIDEVLRLAVTVVRRRRLKPGVVRWLLPTPKRQSNGMHLAIRLTEDDQGILDFLLLPHRNGQGPFHYLDDERSPWIAACRETSINGVAEHLASPARAARRMRARIRRWERAAVTEGAPTEDPPFRRWSGADESTLRRLAQQGERRHQVALQLGRSDSAVKQKANKMGVEFERL